MKTPPTLTVTESHQLLDALLVKEGTHDKFSKGLRNYTMALLMLDAGLRVGEVVHMQIDDLIYNSLPVRSIIVYGDISKNDHQRIIPTSVRLQDALKSMLDSWWSLFTDFPVRSAFFRTKPQFPLSTRQVERIIKRAAMRSIKRPIHPHILRHTFASRLMRKVNLRVVQELLGHKHITSTQVYTHPNHQDLTDAIDSLC